MKNREDALGSPAENVPPAPAVRRREPTERRATIERKLKSDVEAWLRRKRSAR